MMTIIWWISCLYISVIWCDLITLSFPIQGIFICMTSTQRVTEDSSVSLPSTVLLPTLLFFLFLDILTTMKMRNEIHKMGPVISNTPRKSYVVNLLPLCGVLGGEVFGSRDPNHFFSSSVILFPSMNSSIVLETSGTIVQPL